MKNRISTFPFIRFVSKLIWSRNGSIAPLMALILPLILGAGGLSMDYAFMRLKAAELQDAADAAAIAGSRELSVSLQGTAHIDAVVANYVGSSLADISDLNISSAVEGDNDIVSVNLSLDWTPFFAQYFSSNVTPLVISAKAKLAGTGKICVLGLVPDTLAGVHLDNKSKIEAAKCGIYSNSTAGHSLKSDANAKGIASTFCAAGGYRRQGNASFSPLPQTDCPVIPDPLADRAKPTTAGCNFNNLIVSTSQTLSPGIYCGGLTIQGNAKVKLNNGEYVIKDGPLLVRDTGGMSGVGVGFFLTGANSLFEFEPGTSISLEAPIAGAMAGLLFYEDADVPYSLAFDEKKVDKILKAKLRPTGVRVHIISSNDARKLIGTIYLARSVLLINANDAVAVDSAYTAIVVGRLWLQEGPRLVLNADYSVTDVPVPAGLAGGHSRLIE